MQTKETQWALRGSYLWVSIKNSWCSICSNLSPLRKNHIFLRSELHSWIDNVTCNSSNTFSVVQQKGYAFNLTWWQVFLWSSHYQLIICITFGTTEYSPNYSWEFSFQKSCLATGAAILHQDPPTVQIFKWREVEEE